MIQRPGASVTAAVEVHDLTVAYHRKPVLWDVDVLLPAGKLIAIVGPNGAGKSTLMKAILGLVRATEGKARIFGSESTRVASRQEVGFLPENPYFYKHLSGRETMHFYGKLCGMGGEELKDRAEEVLAIAGLTSAAERRVGGYSKGMLQRVGLAQALIHRPRLLILDEPTAGVDVELRQTLWAFVRGLNAAGHTIVLTTHYLEEAQQLCTRIAMMRDGRIVALDSTARLLASFSERVLRVKLEGGALPPELAGQATDEGGARRFGLVDDLGELLVARHRAAVEESEGVAVLVDVVEVGREAQLDHLVRSVGRRHRLVMRRIHRHARAAHDARQQCPRRDGDLMPRLRARVRLLMRERAGDLVRDVLDQRPAEGDGEQLLPAADPQHRHVAFQCGARRRQLEIRPPRLQRHLRMRRPAAPQRRIHVEGPAGHQQPVHLVQVGPGEVRMMRQRDRQPPRRDHGREIVLPQRVPGQLGPAAGRLNKPPPRPRSADGLILSRQRRGHARGAGGFHHQAGPAPRALCRLAARCCHP